MSQYKIIRTYFTGERYNIKKGLNLEEAQKHCRDPETSSSTCSGATARDVPGQWFDGYEEI